MHAGPSPPPPFPPPQAKYLGVHTNKTTDQIITDFARPKYFNAYEAMQYGIIDKVSRTRPFSREALTRHHGPPV